MALLLVLPLTAGCPDGSDDATSATEGAMDEMSSSSESTSLTSDPSTNGTSGDPPESTGSTSSAPTTSTTTGDSSTGDGSTSTEATSATTTSTGTADGTTFDTTDATSTGGTTTGFACGNGVKDEDEDCDPNDPDLVEVAVCTDSCTWNGVVVFVTDQGFFGNFGGAEEADQLCRDAAAQAKLKYPEEYTAWLSVGAYPAWMRIPLVDKPYYLLNKEAIAMTQEELLSGKLLHAINVTEKKETADNKRVWTNTTPNGETASFDDDCQSFTQVSDSDFAPIGITSSTAAAWTYTSDPEVLLGICNKEYRLYCFSRDF